MTPNVVTTDPRRAVLVTGARTAAPPRPIPMACLIAILTTGLIITGCVPTPETAFDSPAPNKRLDAIVQATGRTDHESLAGLVSQLESTDPAARLLAIRALEQRTGQTLGYEHAGQVRDRRAAVSRWKEYLEDHADTTVQTGDGRP